MYWSKTRENKKDDVMGSKKLWIQLKVKVKSLSHVPLFATPSTVAYLAPTEE